MMLSLIYLVLYFAVFCVTGVVLSLFFFIHYMTLANPMGIVLQ